MPKLVHSLSEHPIVPSLIRDVHFEHGSLVTTGHSSKLQKSLIFLFTTVPSGHVLVSVGQLVLTHGKTLQNESCGLVSPFGHVPTDGHGVPISAIVQDVSLKNL